MSKNILVVAGGTGGHILPGIVFGKKLRDEGNNVYWACGAREMEQKIYNALGIEPLKLAIEGSPLGVKSFLVILTRSITVLTSYIQTLTYIIKYKIDEIYLFGGYVSYAPLKAALRKKIPVTLHEQNAVAGKVTRKAAKKGVKIITGWPVCEGINDFTYVGIPAREPVRISRDEALKTLGLDLNVNAKIVGITGGSLASETLSNLLLKTADLCKEFEFVFLSHERKDEGNIHFIPQSWDMNPFYSICDILVCRSGGSTLAEALEWGMSTVTIPWPEAADNHQEKNAEEFVKLAKNSYAFNENDSPEKLAEIIAKI